MPWSGGCHNFGSEQRPERFGERGPDAVLVDVDHVEQCLVEQPAGSVVCLQVGAVAVVSQVERGFQVGLHGVEVDAGGVQAAFDEFQLAGDPVLLRFQ
ncbi:MAG TPA: hypothetical protein VF557_07705 [Jatrophihabitans sp.]|uniref:hypothetical protein n=1 Tax=Jatrophihabitans sp. TaxID=1932789 RepID=UPI002F14C454